MLLQLKRAPEVEAAFEAYIDSLTDKSSPNFRHWLTAAEQGEKYGVAQQDIDAISAWLQSEGFSVNHVYPNRMVIDFSGSAGQVRNAFHTEIHHLVVGGKPHIANVSDPQIPAALAPAIHGVVSMHDFRPDAYHRLKTDYTLAGCGSNCYALVAEDFQTIYNLTPLYAAGITGKGQTVAVVEDTNTFGSDWTNYRSKFKLATYGGTLTTVHPNSAGNCTNPGTNPDDAEADLDVEMITAAAPGAAVEVISCSDTSTTFGGLIAIQNLISAATPPPIISMSYGVCEAVNGAAANAAFNSAFQSAAAAGISVFTSAGDNGPSTLLACSITATAGRFPVSASPAGARANTPFPLAAPISKTSTTPWKAELGRARIGTPPPTPTSGRLSPTSRRFPGTTPAPVTWSATWKGTVLPPGPLASVTAATVHSS